METSVNQTTIALDGHTLSNSSPRPKRGFWSLIATQFQDEQAATAIRGRSAHNYALMLR